MKKKLAVLVLSLFSINTVFAAPTNSMSITTPSTRTIISSSDESTRYNEVTTKFNAHSHEDLTKTTANTFTVGDGADSDKTFAVDTTNSSDPYLRYDVSEDIWVFNTSASASGLVDKDNDTKVQVEETDDEDKIRFDTAGAQRALIDSDGLTLSAGASVNEFSTDGTLSGNSDDAVPTEKALVTHFADYFLNTDDTFTGTASFVNDANANLISLTNTGTGYDIYCLDSGSTGYALWAEKTATTTATTFAKFVHAEHGSDITINFQTENDSGTEKNFSITADPDANHLQLATDVDVTGELTAGTKTFKIDHPLAPHDKFYYHGVVESPKFGLIYDGKITLTAGQASINLDEYYGQTAGTFEAVVRKDTRRVFLQNNDTWDLVKGSVADGVLTVVADKSNSTAAIDWMITGERADSFAIDSKLTDDDGRFILEVDKPSLDEDDLAKIANPGEEEYLKFPNKKGYLRHPKKNKKSDVK